MSLPWIRLTWNLKGSPWKMIFLYNMAIFRFHVNLTRCIFFVRRFHGDSLNLRCLAEEIKFHVLEDDW